MTSSRQGDLFRGDEQSELFDDEANTPTFYPDAATPAARTSPQQAAPAKLLELNLARAEAGDLLVEADGEDEEEDDDDLPAAKPVKKAPAIKARKKAT